VSQRCVTSTQHNWLHMP